MPHRSLCLLFAASLLLSGCGDPAPTPAMPPDEPGPLARELQAKAAAGAAKAPAEIKAVLQKAGAELAASGQLEKARRVGAEAPDFRLSDGMGRAMSLAALRNEGPVVLTFYRGKW